MTSPLEERGKYLELFMYATVWDVIKTENAKLKREIETAEIVRQRIIEAATVLGDEKLVYVAPDCGLRQLSLERSVRIYDLLVEGAELARKG